MNQGTQDYFYESVDDLEEESLGESEDLGESDLVLLAVSSDALVEESDDESEDELLDDPDVPPPGCFRA